MNDTKLSTNVHKFTTLENEKIKMTSGIWRDRSRKWNAMHVRWVNVQLKMRCAPLCPSIRIYVAENSQMQLTCYKVPAEWAEIDVRTAITHQAEAHMYVCICVKCNMYIQFCDEYEISSERKQNWRCGYAFWIDLVKLYTFYMCSVFVFFFVFLFFLIMTDKTN